MRRMLSILGTLVLLFTIEASVAPAASALKCPLTGLITCIPVTTTTTVRIPTYTSITLPPKTVTKTRTVTETQRVVQHQTRYRTRTQQIPALPRTVTSTQNIPQPVTTQQVLVPGKNKTVTKAHIKTVTATTTAVRDHTRTINHSSVVTLTKTEAVTYSTGLVAGGVLVVLIILWLMYVLGYKSSDADERKQLRSIIATIRRR